MFWKVVLVIAELLDTIIDKFVPNRKEHNTDKYHNTLKNIRNNSKDRQRIPPERCYLGRLARRKAGNDKFLGLIEWVVKPFLGKAKPYPSLL